MAKSTESNNPENPSQLARTPLYDLSLELKARMVPFSGWEMAVQYSGLSNEHQIVRSQAGMFDISHMGKFGLRGKQLREKFQSLVPSDLSRLQPGQAQYTLLLNAKGCILDDIIFYCQEPDATTSEERAVIIVNAATRIRDKAWIVAHLELSNVSFTDLSPDKILIAIQGPEAVNYLQPLVADNLTPIKAFGHLETNLLGQPSFIARTGYTGEDGFEIMVDAEVGKELWQQLLTAGVVPCGLGARDTLRLEAAMALYGQDIDDNTTPLEAGLGWVVHLDSKGDFIGREVLEQQKASGVSKRLVGLEMAGKHIARHGYPVIFEGEKVGEVTSGTLSPTLNKPIALAYVPTKLAKIGQELEVEIRGKNYPATVVKKPFYRSPNRPS
ncbi:MAG: glycine cleavage system aminomethyltransferase GcvT [Tychonema bourrellyi B0820]|uniref:Aminomethyltransferase n=1 Tax=Tychonema bourrellyi FEM_GT703 TaxID=2040638 RepID=A0A2G4EXN5_9CYAN|nr:glycine cleavage system aminomethyltransferase GcvT [Tychonema bourrellyi]MDQ2096726.1 glycine cleavage system aminomethyltransferase GcvT [Tychonema bourrellyi B0820]PHX54295.1 glycine cleavage system protein T [Tychonema bourrellyi FEM_GT703]